MESIGDITAIYSSDLIRAFKTAKIAFPEYEIKINKNLREQDFGPDVDSLDEFLKSNPEYVLNKKEAFDRRFPNGESINDVKNRVEDALYTIIESHEFNDTIVVVSHFTPLLCILSIITNNSLDKVWSKEHIKNGEAIHFKYNKNNKFEIINRFVINN